MYMASKEQQGDGTLFAWVCDIACSCELNQTLQVVQACRRQPSNSDQSNCTGFPTCKGAGTWCLCPSFACCTVQEGIGVVAGLKDKSWRLDWRLPSNKPQSSGDLLVEWSPLYFQSQVTITISLNSKVFPCLAKDPTWTEFACLQVLMLGYTPLWSLNGCKSMASSNVPSLTLLLPLQTWPYHLKLGRLYVCTMNHEPPSWRQCSCTALLQQSLDQV